MATHFITYRPNIDRSRPEVLDRYEDFLSWKKHGAIEGWSARKTFQPGDLVIFYMAAPLMAIVGLGLVDSEPYYEEADDPADYKNPVSCDFRPVWFLGSSVPIKDAVEHRGLEAWWSTRPYQSIRKIEPPVARALLQEILGANPDLPIELEQTGSGDFHLTQSGVTSPLRGSSPKSREHQWEITDLLDLSWEQFEWLVSEVFRRRNQGAEVKLTPKKDWGADVVITKRWLAQKEIVQCKRYRAGLRVSAPDMQMFIGAMTKFKAKKGYFVTSSEFGRYAVDYAKGFNVELINGQRLIQMIGQIESFPSPAQFIRQHS